MFKLLMYGAMGYAGHRAYKAHKIGLPLDMAFQTDHLFKPVESVKKNLIAGGVLKPVVRKAATAGAPRPISYDPDDVMVPDWF